VAGEPGGEPRRDGGVGGHEDFEGVGREAVLVKKNEDVDEDKGGVDEGVGAAGVEVFERDEQGRELGIAEYRKRRELQGAGTELGASDNIVVAPTWLT